MLKFGFLSSHHHPFLGYYLREFENLGVPVEAILYDSLSFSEKNQKIHEERTQGKMPALALEPFLKKIQHQLTVSNHNSAEAVSAIQSIGIDYLINAGTPRILKNEILNASKHGVLNSHPGLLPQFRGCTCVEWALYLDEQIGSTVHRMTDQIDEGPILLQAPYTFSKSDDYSAIRSKTNLGGVRLMAEAAHGLMTGKLTKKSFKEQGEGRYFKVIDDDKFIIAKKKASDGAYAFQRD